MSGVCWCGNCHGCRLAREAGEQYDADATEAEDKAREKAERDDREEALAEYLDDYPQQDGAPAMSAILESGLTAQQRAECAKHDEEESPKTPWPFMSTLRPREWLVQIKAGSQVVREFPAMGYHRAQVQQQHEGLCEPGQQVIVLTPEEAEERKKDAAWRHRQSDRALDAQMRDHEAAWGRQHG